MPGMIPVCRMNDTGLVASCHIPEPDHSLGIGGGDPFPLGAVGHGISNMFAIP